MNRPDRSRERLAPATAVGLVVIALVLSNLGNAAVAGPVGNTTGAGSEPRIAVGGDLAALDQTGQIGIDDRISNEGAVDGASTGSVGGNGAGADGSAAGPGTTLDSLALSTTDQPAIDGPFSSDGTLLKPVSVDTTVADGSGLMRTYRVRNGDTLTGIASKFHVSMMTVWWANQLKNKNDLKVGQTLTIPPVNGVVVTVRPSDTLESLATAYKTDPADIIAVNQLSDPILVVGQTLTIPGALAASIAAPRPKPKPRSAPTPKPVAHRTSGGGGSAHPPASYGGGRLSWPVPGGYISQYFHYGHWAIDIAAPMGTPVLAAAGGTVIFAGWKNNGGGYQVWIAHGSGLYTTYNHMSSVAVGRGQSVGRGQRVGRVGMTGDATGPHCHFEVWIGPIWNGGTRVNPLNYL